MSHDTYTHTQHLCIKCNEIREVYAATKMPAPYICYTCRSRAAHAYAEAMQCEVPNYIDDDYAVDLPDPVLSRVECWQECANALRDTFQRLLDRGATIDQLESAVDTFGGYATEVLLEFKRRRDDE